MSRIYDKYDSNRNKVFKLYMNEYESDMLTVKAEKCGISKSIYLRELICGCCPTEAPSQRFYEMYEELNQVLNEVVRLKDDATAESYMGKEDAAVLLALIAEIREILFSMKIEVLQSKPRSNDYFEEIVEKRGG